MGLKLNPQFFNFQQSEAAAESVKNVDTVRYFAGADGTETPNVAFEMKNVNNKKTSNVGVVNERQGFSSKLHKPGKSRKSKLLLKSW